MFFQTEYLKPLKDEPDAPTIPNSYLNGLQVKSESGKRVYQCPKPECGKIYSNSRSLLVHLKNFHLFGDFKCDFCPDFQCHFAQDQFRHRSENHPESAFKCPVCQKVDFSDPNCDMISFENHYLECFRLKRRDSQPKSKPKEKKFGCDQCGKGFPKERLLKEHQNWHKGKN